MKSLQWCYFIGLLISGSITISYASTPLKSQPNNAQSDTAHLSSYIKLIRFYYSRGQLDSCQVYMDKGVRLAKKAKLTTYYSDLYRVCGACFRKQGRLKESIGILNKASYWAMKNNQKAILANIDYGLAINYSDKALMSNKKTDFTAALSKIYQNILFTNRYHFFDMEANNYGLLSSFYEIYGNDSVSYQFLEKVVNLKEKVKVYNTSEASQFAKLYLLASQVQLNLFYKRYSQVNTNLHRLLQFRNKTTMYEYNAYVGLVEIYTKLGYYTQAINIATIIQKNAQIMPLITGKDKFWLFCCLTSAYLHKHNYQKAKQTYQKTIAYAAYEKTSEFKIPSASKVRLLQNQRELLEYEHRFQAALLVTKKLELLKNTIRSNQATFELAASQERFERKSNENRLLHQIKLQKLENDYKERILNQSKKIQWLSVLIIIVLIIVILFVTFQVKKSNNQALILKQLNNNQNKIFSIISHDLRSPVASLQTFLSIINTKPYSKKVMQTFSDLEMQVEIVSNTLDNLLNWSITQMGSIKPTIRSISLQNCIEHIIELSNPIIQYKCITIIKNIEDTYTYADENLTEVVIRNVLNNAIKFSSPRGLIKVSSISRNDEFILQIQDYGVGMSAAQIESLFLAYNSRKGTMGEKGSGLGLKLSRDLMVMQGGRIEISSTVDAGTMVNLVFKKRLIK